MKKVYKLLLLAFLLSSSLTASADYELVWSDEFDCEYLNPSVWQYEIGTGYQGWGNWEAEYYTSSRNNVFISNGNLVIKAIKDETKYDSKYNTHFTSGSYNFKRQISGKVW